MADAFERMMHDQLDAHLSTRSYSELQKLRSLLLRMQSEQEDDLHNLEAAYRSLLKTRRNELLNHIRSSDGSETKNGSAQSGSGSLAAREKRLKQMHTNASEELAAFLKVRVFHGWQEAQLLEQLRRLKSDSGLPETLVEACWEGGSRRGIQQTRKLVVYLMQQTL